MKRQYLKPEIIEHKLLTESLILAGTIIKTLPSEGHGNKETGGSSIEGTDEYEDEDDQPIGSI